MRQHPFYVQQTISFSRNEDGMDVPMASRELTPVESHANDSSLLARSGSLKQEHSKNIGLSIFLVAGKDE
ncbi:hypothetical protein GFC30_3040 (plasmid) [Anoxybacillus amylolyticus]|uniref:Uncharacterized protein n=1 Tax=Anoxybacteroides amylolyticum TaxID=294699 RepID=A0A160F6J0_9BACL|nr:hypothetical protein GFC30_3040 [Anoxybacillus amylolyticus]